MAAAGASMVLMVLMVVLAAVNVGASDSAFLLVHKTADLKRVKSGLERITVFIALHNAGASTAYDVSLDDSKWDGFSVTSGNTSAAWEKLEVGKSLQHSFVLESSSKGIFYGEPAKVKYRVAAKAHLQKALSTPLPPLDILSDKPIELKYDWLKVIAARYSSLAIVLSIIGLFIYLLVAPSPKKTSKATKKRR